MVPARMARRSCRRCSASSMAPVPGLTAILSVYAEIRIGGSESAPPIETIDILHKAQQNIYTMTRSLSSRVEFLRTSRISRRDNDLVFSEVGLAGAAARQGRAACRGTAVPFRGGSGRTPDRGVAGR